LEEGVSLRLINQWLGHQHLETTLIYLQCTRTNEATARQAQERLLAACGQGALR
jgi:site-specific recombinase XerD